VAKTGRGERPCASLCLQPRLILDESHEKNNVRQV